MDQAKDHRDPCCHLHGVPPRAMEDLGGGHVTESETPGDVGHGSALDGRLPEGLALAFRKLFEHDTDEVAIGDGVLHVGCPAGIGAERDQRPSQSLSAPQQVEAVVGATVSSQARAALLLTVRSSDSSAIRKTCWAASAASSGLRRMRVHAFKTAA
jgi:hypothetical protein